MDFLALNWNELQTKTFELSKKIKNEKIDLIVAIARGGLCISHILSDFLGVSITSFTISSYSDLKQEKSLKILYKIDADFSNKKILLVDDVSDTGKTFIRGIEYLKELGAKEIKTASLFIKPWTKFLPDFYVDKTSSWIIFPCEIKETIISLVNKFKKTGLNDKDIKLKLKKIGINNFFVDKFL